MWVVKLDPELQAIIAYKGWQAWREMATEQFAGSMAMHLRTLPDLEFARELEVIRSEEPLFPQAPVKAAVENLSMDRIVTRFHGTIYDFYFKADHHVVDVVIERPIRSRMVLPLSAFNDISRDSFPEDLDPAAVDVLFGLEYILLRCSGNIGMLNVAMERARK